MPVHKKILRNFIILAQQARANILLPQGHRRYALAPLFRRRSVLCRRRMQRKANPRLPQGHAIVAFHQIHRNSAYIERAGYSEDAERLTRCCSPAIFVIVDICHCGAWRPLIHCRKAIRLLPPNIFGERPIFECRAAQSVLPFVKTLCEFCASRTDGPKNLCRTASIALSVYNPAAFVPHRQGLCLEAARPSKTCPKMQPANDLRKNALWPSIYCFSPAEFTNSAKAPRAGLSGYAVRLERYRPLATNAVIFAVCRAELGNQLGGAARPCMPCFPARRRKSQDARPSSYFMNPAKAGGRAANSVLKAHGCLPVHNRGACALRLSKGP